MDLFGKGDKPIKKSIVHLGRGEVPSYKDGAKVTFHYTTRLCNDEHTVIDDSRKECKDKPMELIFGKKFKLEAWEMCLQTMKVAEVASFIVHPSLLVTYPQTMKTLRDVRRGKSTSAPSHCCGGLGMKAAQHTGYEDLDELTKSPAPLEFILELLSYNDDGEYKKDTWAMSDQEKQAEVPKLKQKADELYHQKDYTGAAELYGQAIGMLDQLMLREKPRDDPWIELDNKRIPLLMNYSQCKLLVEDYYPVIEHTTEVLEKDPDNVKALFRRAKAHVGVWNPQEAKDDFTRCLELDKTLQRAIQAQLANINKLQAQRDKEDREKLAGKLLR